MGFEIQNNIYKEKKFQNAIKIIKSYNYAKLSSENEEERYKSFLEDVSDQEIIDEAAIFSIFQDTKDASIIERLDSVLKQFGYHTQGYIKNDSITGLKKYEDRVNLLKEISQEKLIERLEDNRNEINKLKSNLINDKEENIIKIEEKYLKSLSNILEKQHKKENNIWR